MVKLIKFKDILQKYDPVTAKIKKDLLENKALYEWEETLILDEKKRQSGKSKTIDTYGADGTFKKLELD